MQANLDRSDALGDVGQSQSDIRDAMAILRAELQDSLGRSHAFAGEAAWKLENIHEASQVSNR